jgi:UDP-N-acetylmuramoylalanine--D-glutamate ligase
MIDLRIFKDRRIAVMGLGLSGLVAAEALCAGGADVLAWDDNDERRAEAVRRGVPVAPLVEADWSSIDSLVLSPGIPHLHPAPNPVARSARDAGVEIIGDIELLIRAQPSARYVGVTGTNGKSTTTALIGHILKTVGARVAVGGNLGLPALSLEALGADGIYVLEMSSYQLELTPSARFDVAILLNLSPDHLDRHGGMAGYIAAKRRIFEQQPEGATAVIGVDDAESVGLYDGLMAAGRGAVIPISADRAVDGGVYACGPVLYDNTTGREHEVRSLAGIETLPGTHNAQNAAAAFAALQALGIESSAIAAALETYPGLPHRQQLAAVIDGVKYVNDSKATNPEAAAKALSSYDDILWIAGGRGKEGSLAPLYPYLPRVRRAYLIGEAAGTMALELKGRVATQACGNLENALDAASRDASGTEAVVLLSPACASFDQFSSFEERGRVFCRLAAALPGGRRDVRYAGEAA